MTSAEREFWERAACGALPGRRQQPSFAEEAESAACMADALLYEWRKRFNLPKEKPNADR